MRLHHTTRREYCESIAREGFRNSDNLSGTPLPEDSRGVFLSPPGMLWLSEGSVAFDPADGPAADFAWEVIFAFDIPDDVAARYGLIEEAPDPAQTLEELDAGAEVRWTEQLTEYLIPADTVNRYCVGPVAWVGEPPLSDDLLALIRARREAAVD